MLPCRDCVGVLQAEKNTQDLFPKTDRQIVEILVPPTSDWSTNTDNTDTNTHTTMPIQTTSNHTLREYRPTHRLTQ